MNLLKNQKGITLVALVITIIILIILAGITISIVLGDNGLIAKASRGAQAYNEAATGEQDELNKINTILDAINLGGTTTPTEPSTPTETTISKTTSESFVGKYADINGDGIIDGIIYIDLLAQAGQTGRWTEDTRNLFTVPSTVTSSNVRDYVVSQTAQTDTRFDNTPRDVIRLATNQTGTEDRFYVMGLDNIKDSSNNDELYWYYEAYWKMEDYASTAPNTQNVGTGRANTAAVKAKWDLGEETGGYGAQNSRDLWGYLPSTPKAGANVIASESDILNYRWFIPSRAELCAFAYNLEITDDNYTDKGLDNYYWSSSQEDHSNAWDLCIGAEDMFSENVDFDYHVRVSATF